LRHGGKRDEHVDERDISVGGLPHATHPCGRIDRGDAGETERLGDRQTRLADVPGSDSAGEIQRRS
jgi:hypothetical protein